MPHGLIPVLVIVALVAGLFSYLSAYHQISHLYVAREARRRALGAAVGPVSFYGVLAGILFVGVPLAVHP
jgi:hypothetical protein